VHHVGTNMDHRATRPFTLLMTFLITVMPMHGFSMAAFDPRPWLEDLQQVREALLTKYANLEWVVIEREVNLESLFASTTSRLEAATSDAEARAAISALTKELGDAHVGIRWNKRAASETPHADCAQLGYSDETRSGGVGRYIPGFSPINDSSAKEFPAGVIPIQGHRVGVLGIGIFTPDGVPELCSEALSALHLAPDSLCDDACSDTVGAWVSARMTRDLAEQLRALSRAKAEVLLVDITGNGGGTQWAEAAARMMTPLRLKSERMGFVRGPHWAKHFAETVASLREDARLANSADKAMLNELADTALGYQKEAETPCDGEPLWQGKSPSCSWLGKGFFASGVIDSADPKALQGRSWAADVFSPSQYPYEEGIWRRPLIVLVDGGTGSAAEQFAAVLQDNHAAVILGAPTVGAGCGHTNGGTPTTLKNSGGVLILPDCARIRADGQNEVMGVQPDILVGLRDSDGPHRKGTRVLEQLQPAVIRAISQNKETHKHSS
jgi:hypothetical protein